MRSRFLSDSQNVWKFIFLLVIVILLVSSPFWLSGIFVNIYLQQGENLWQQNKLAEAIAVYQKAIALEPNHSESYWRLGQLLYQQGEFSESLVNLQQASKISPQFTIKFKYANLYYDLGEKLEQQGKLTEAITAYRQAILINPSYAEAYNQLGNILSKQQDLPAAVNAYQKALELNTNYVEAYNNLGKVFFQQDKWQQAIQYYQQALQIDPTYPDTYSNLGEAFFQQEQYAQAITFYEQAIYINPKDTIAYEHLCYSLNQQRRFTEGIRYCQQALKINPDFNRVRIYLNEVQRDLALAKNPQIANLPEIIPSLDTDPDVKLKRSIVRIITNSRTEGSIGTGWIVKRKGNKAWIITNRHVVTQQQQKSASTIEVEFYSTPSSGQFRQRRIGKIIHKTAPDDWLDLAVLEINNLPEDIQPLSLALSPISLQDSIRLIGHPHTISEWAVSIGNVNIITDRRLQLSAAISSGSSGSPVFNSDNQVIGLAVAVKLFCDRTLESNFVGIDVPLNCSVAFPIDVVRERLQKWGLIAK